MADTWAGDLVKRQDTEQHTCQRIIDWLQSSPRPPAHVAFTEGPLRDVAYAVEGELGKVRERCANIADNYITPIACEIADAIRAGE